MAAVWASPKEEVQVNIDNLELDYVAHCLEYVPESSHELITGFHEFQRQAWDSTTRFTALIAGTQGGKTSFALFWLLREIILYKGGDFIVAAPTFPLLKMKLLSVFEWLFMKRYKLGKMNSSDMIFQGSVNGFKFSVKFGYATKPDSLESMTAKAAVLDECGQGDFKIGSWEAIQRRLSINKGRALLGTTPYNLGWVKTAIWDKRNSDKDLCVISFPSNANPTFPKEIYEKAKRDLPDWKFDMMYKGLFTRPAGLIYGCFESETMIINQMPVPQKSENGVSWHHFLGLDFGAVNTAALFVALYRVENVPDKWGLIIYDEYHASGDVATHAKYITDKGINFMRVFGGSHQEDGTRNAYQYQALNVREPLIGGVEDGIDNVYRLIREGRVRIMGNCTGLIEQIGTYSRETDIEGEVLDTIKDKAKYHLIDALRYVLSYFKKDHPIPKHDPSQQKREQNKEFFGTRLAKIEQLWQ